LVGSNVSFSVMVSGTPPFSYHWTMNGTNVPRAVQNTYTLTSVQASAAGTYAVQITNAFGHATSSNAVLTVNAPPCITQQPLSQSVCPSNSVTLTVAASGTAPLSYQWSCNGTNLAGATSSAYTLNNLSITNAGQYQVVVTNVAGSVTSSNAVLFVGQSPPGVGFTLVSGQAYMIVRSSQATTITSAVNNNNFNNPSTNPISVP